MFGDLAVNALVEFVCRSYPLVSGLVVGVTDRFTTCKDCVQ